MHLLLFVGFLGSGKTTLILALARHVARPGSRVCVVVNEVGEVGIDGEVLRFGDLEVKEISGGCICCQVGVDLVRTVRQLEEEFQPELVIVEASGLATPEGVIDALQRYPAKTLGGISTIAVVDASRFEELHEVLTPLIEAQIEEADTVVVTKSDEATTAEVEETTKAVSVLAPSAPLHVVDATSDSSLADLLASLGSLATDLDPRKNPG